MTDKQNNENTTFIVSSSPHAHSGENVQRIMMDVVIALIPAALAAFYFFGFNAFKLTAVCVISCVLSEMACRWAMKREQTVMDFSAVITGLLLAFNLPPTLPVWQAVIGSIFAIVVAKQLFGGLGYNVFNPALAGRIFLFISRPEMCSGWITPDGTTGATPLGLLKLGEPITFNSSVAMQYFIGNMSGCIGEVSALALLLGGAYMLYRKVITWHIPVSYIGTTVIFAALIKHFGPEGYPVPLFHILTGGLMLGAIFMATDMVTSPVTKKGMLVFGAGCGILTMLIRVWGSYPEGVSFSIFIMNALTPLINKATKPRLFGRKK